MFLYNGHDDRGASCDKETEFYDLFAKYCNKVRTFYTRILEYRLFIDTSYSPDNLLMHANHLIRMNESS